MAFADSILFPRIIQKGVVLASLVGMKRKSILRHNKLSVDPGFFHLNVSQDRIVMVRREYAVFGGIRINCLYIFMWVPTFKY